ncbi:MAG: sensor histidine kinase [Tannerellaceae bacterium]|jgi:signal transduction histidine kinase|nr:sensor histidine kinase [Tannerellaceae bacterium]
MKKIFFLFLCLFPMLLNAQQLNVDSLKNVLNTKKVTPGEQLELYYKIFGTYAYYDIEKASEFAEKGLIQAEKENNKIMTSKFNAAIGRIYGTKSSYDTAFIYYEKALDFAQKAKNNAQEAAVYGDIGILYARQDRYTSALEYFMKALSVYEATGDKQACVKIMSNISSLYRGMENDERVIYYLEKAKGIAEEIEYDEGKMQVYFELGAICHKLAGNNDEHDKAKLALEYELKAYALSHKLDHKIYQTATAHALSEIYYDYLRDYDNALKYANECLQIAPETGDPKMLTVAWGTISNVYRVQNRFEECEDAAFKAWAIDSTGIYTGSDLLKNIIVSNIALGNNNKALMFFKKYDDYIKTQTNQSSRKTMADMEAKYETEKKEMRIAALENEQKLYIWLGASIVVALLSVIVLLFYCHRLSTQKRKIAEQQIKQLEQEKELVAARSALDAEKAEREIIARDLHDGVGAMLSVVKNNMNIMKSYSVIENKEAEYFNKALDGLDKSIVELRRVSHHIMPAPLVEKGLIPALDDFCRSIPEAEFHFMEPCRRFDSDKELVIYRCAYELVSNALKHSGASHIDVHFNIDEETTYLSVVDNGCGFDLQTTPPGMGINNMQTRLSAFGGHIEIYSEPGKGTEANVELKI